MTDKLRLLHPCLAQIVATIRHGETVFIADAGSGTTAKSLVPLDDGVEIVDVAVATGIPTVHQVASALCAAGDFEAAIVTAETAEANPAARREIADLVGTVHEVPYLPDFYQLRNRAKVFVQTGDYGVHANAILVAGYPSPPIPFSWLTSSAWFDDLATRESGKA